MSIVSNFWRKLAKSKKYREEFVAAQVKRGIPFQARALLRRREGWTQGTLAEKAGLTQGVVSRALNPNYGNLTLNTVIRIAAGFDVAFIGKFVPFSELEKWFEHMSEESVQVPTFDEEDRARQSCLDGKLEELALSSFWTVVKDELNAQILSLEKELERRASVGSLSQGFKAEQGLGQIHEMPPHVTSEGFFSAATEQRGAAA